MTFNDNSGFSIGTVTATGGSTTNGLTTTGNTTLTTTGSVDQTQAIAAATLFLEGGTFDLNGANNAVTTLDADNTTLAGDLTFQDNTGFSVDGIDAGANNVELSSTGTVTTGTNGITAAGLSLLGAGGDFTLTNTANAITDLAANTGDVSFLDNNGFNIDAVTVTGGGTTIGLTTTGNATLSTTATAIDLHTTSVGGDLDVTALGITDSGTVTVSGTTTLAAGAGNDITLADAASDYNTVLITSGKIM